MKPQDTPPLSRTSSTLGPTRTSWRRARRGPLCASSTSSAPDQRWTPAKVSAAPRRRAT